MTVTIVGTSFFFLTDKGPYLISCLYYAFTVTPGQSILCADGSLVLTVLSCDVPASEVTCRIENSCSIGERKNMNLPGVVVDLPTLTAKDIDDIVQWGIPNKVGTLLFFVNCFQRICILYLFHVTLLALTFIQTIVLQQKRNQIFSPHPSFAGLKT